MWDADMATRVAYGHDMEFEKGLLSKLRTPKAQRMGQRDRWMRAAWSLVEGHEDVMRMVAAPSPYADAGASDRGGAVSVAALPRVEGRHRNRALAAARRARAIELRAQGWTYEQIAAELGYANGGTVCHIVSHALATQEAEAIEDLRFVERERLDALQVALWDRDDR